MNRRELMLVLGGAMTAARTLRAQQKSMPVIGFLGAGSPGPLATVVPALHRKRLCRRTKRYDRIPLGGGPL